MKTSDCIYSGLIDQRLFYQLKPFIVLFGLTNVFEPYIQASLNKISFKDTRWLLPIFMFFSSVISFVFLSFKISDSIISNLEENDLGSRSSVSVSPTKFSSLLKNITLSRL